MNDYYAKLGRDRSVRTPADLAIFETRIKYEAKEGASLSKIVEHFWQASRAVSLTLNKNHAITKAAHKFMARKISDLHDLFLAGGQVATAEDLERIMGMQMRLQVVPPSPLMMCWAQQSLSQIDQLSDGWFKANFNHFTKLGVYPQDEFITAWWKQTAPRIHTFAEVDQYRILYRMAQLDFLRSADHGEIYAGLPSPCRAVAEDIFSIIEPQAKTLFAQHINNQVFFAGLWFGKDFVRGITVTGNYASNASELEGKVARSIGATSIHVNQSGIMVPVTGHKIDLALKYKGQIFGCEVDGISHFNFIAATETTEKAVVYDTSTRFHSALIARFLGATNVLRVPYFCFDETETGIPWEKTLNSIARKEGHAVYAWHGGSKHYDLHEKKNAHLFRGRDL